MTQLGTHRTSHGLANAPSAVDDPRVSQALEEYLAAWKRGTVRTNGLFWRPMPKSPRGWPAAWTAWT